MGVRRVVVGSRDDPGVEGVTPAVGPGVVGPATGIPPTVRHQCRPKLVLPSGEGRGRPPGRRRSDLAPRTGVGPCRRVPVARIRPFASVRAGPAARLPYWRHRSPDSSAAHASTSTSACPCRCRRCQSRQRSQEYGVPRAPVAGASQIASSRMTRGTVRADHRDPDARQSRVPGPRGGAEGREAAPDAEREEQGAAGTR